MVGAKVEKTQTNALSEREEMGVRRGNLSGEVGEETVSTSS